VAFEHGNLLAESEDLQGRVGSCPEGGSECNEEGEEELEHELRFQRNVTRGRSVQWMPAQPIDFIIRRSIVNPQAPTDLSARPKE
jgi:hypothetical protein